MTLFSTGQPGRHPLETHTLDFYPTPPFAVTSLLDATPGFRPENGARVWEPAAGDGAIVNVLRDAGFPVIASDVVARDFHLHFTEDFLRTEKVPEGCNAIVTNPPYQIAEAFVRHALQMEGVAEVFFLLRLAFLESIRRTPLLEHHSGFNAVYVFRKRLPRMHRDGWTGPRTSSSVAFAWFSWRRGHAGPPIIVRI